VLACLICQMGLGFGYVFGPLARDIIGELEWTRTMYSAARAPQLFIIALASPLIGWATVRFGAGRILCVSAVLLGAAFLLLSGLSQLWQLYGIIAIVGLSVAGLGDISVGQLASQWVVRNRGLALGIVYTGSNLGGFVLTRSAAAVADADSWRHAFFYMGVLALILILPAAIWLSLQGRGPSHEDSHPASGDGAPAKTSDDPGGDSDLDLRAAIRTRSFWILFVSLLTFFFYFLGMLEHMVLFLTDEGMDRKEATRWFSNAILLGIVSKLALGAIADRIAHKAALLLDYALLAFSSLILLALPNAWLLPIFIVSYGFATAARDVVYPLIITHCFGLRYMAQIYGAMLLALLPGGIAGPIFAAAIHDQQGSYAMAFQAFAAVNILAVVTLFGRRDERAPLAG
jgi:MFS family permease